PHAYRDWNDSDPGRAGRHVGHRQSAASAEASAETRMIMRAVVLQSNYLPWKGYFDLIQSADVFVYYDEVQYTKNDWRNRNRIYPKNGLQWLTIPVSRDSVKLKIGEVRLPEAQWQEDHFKILHHSYRTARCFHQLEPLLHDFYRARVWTFLSELNRY